MPGQEVNALVLDVNPEQKRISLSIKALIQPEEEEYSGDYYDSEVQEQTSENTEDNNEAVGNTDSAE